MLCNVEIGRTKGSKSSLTNYWVIAPTLLDACKAALKEAKKEYPDEDAEWYDVIEAEVKSGYDPLTV